MLPFSAGFPSHLKLQWYISSLIRDAASFPDTSKALILKGGPSAASPASASPLAASSAIVTSGMAAEGGCCQSWWKVTQGGSGRMAGTCKACCPTNFGLNCLLTKEERKKQTTRLQFPGWVFDFKAQTLFARGLLPKGWEMMENVVSLIFMLARDSPNACWWHSCG